MRSNISITLAKAHYKLSEGKSRSNCAVERAQGLDVGWAAIPSVSSNTDFGDQSGSPIPFLLAVKKRIP